MANAAGTGFAPDRPDRSIGRILMNPLAALLATLTGAAQGQSAASPSGGAGTDMFAGLLAALGEGNQSGEALVPGAPAVPAPAGGGVQASLLIALEGEGGLTSIAGAAPQIPQTALHTGTDQGVVLPDQATADTIDGLLRLLRQAACLSPAGMPPQAATAHPGAPDATGAVTNTLPTGPADSLLPGAEIGGLAITNPEAPAADAEKDPTNDGEEVADPLSLLLAGAGLTTPVIAEAPPQGQAANLVALDQYAEANVPVTPAAAGAQATPPVAPQSPPSGPAAAADRSAAAPASTPTPQPQHAAPVNGAPSPEWTPQPEAAGSSGGSQLAPAHDEASLAADFDHALETSAEAVRPDAAGRVKPSAGSSTLETLLQHAQSHQGDGQTRVPPAAGAADMGSLPQQTRPAAPAATSLPPVPIAAVAVNIAQQAQAGAKRFEIRLEPPELGRVEVRLDVTREGHATTHLVVERSETLDMLQRDARQLERALQNAGLNTSNSDLTFSLKDQGNAHHQGFGGGEQQPPTSEAPASNEPVEEDWQPVPIRGLGQAGIDIRI